MRKSLFFKLIFPTVLIACFVLAVLVPIVAYMDRELVEQNTKEELSRLSSSLSHAIADEVNHLESSVRSLTQVPAFERSLSGDDPVDLTPLLLPIKISQGYDFIALINQGPEPLVFLNSSDLSHEFLLGIDLVQRGLLGLNLASLLSVDGMFYSIAVIPVNLLDRPRVLLAGRKLQSLTMWSHDQSSKNRVAILYDLNGRADRLASEEEWQGDPLSEEVIGRLKRERKPFFQEIIHKGHIRHIVIYGPLEFGNALRAFYSIHIPDSDPLFARKNIILSIAGITSVGILLMILAGYGTSRWISGRIQKLLVATREIANGNFGYQLPLEDDDAIGRLTRSFNQMAENLQQSYQWWQRTFDSMSDAVSIHSQDGTVMRANESLGKLLGLSSDAIIGKKCYEMFHDQNGPIVECPMQKSIASGRPEETEIHNNRLGKWVSISTSPLLNADGSLFSCIHTVRDITARKESEELIRNQLSRLSVLHAIEKAVNSSIDLRSTLTLLAEHVTDRLAMDAATVLIMNRKTRLLEYVVSRGFRSQALKHTHLRPGEGGAGQAALLRKTVVVPDIVQNPDGFLRSESFAREGFVSYIALPLIAKGEVQGVLELFHRSPLEADPEWIDFLEMIADQAAIAVDNAIIFNELQRSQSDLILAYDSTIIGWSKALDMKDKDTEGHSQRVTIMTLNIAQELCIDDERLVHMRRGALLHDIGKMGIPDGILLKQGRLTSEERTLMERHTVLAFEMLNDIDYLRPALDIPYCHHERWDGMGYPRGLKGKEIPLAARIFAVVDVWDALSSDRPYRPAWPMDRVLEHIRSGSGTHFDPDVVKVFLRIFERDRMFLQNKSVTPVLQCESYPQDDPQPGPHED